MTDVVAKRRIPFVASNQVSSAMVGASLQMFYDGNVLADEPSERTVRFATSFARTYPTGTIPIQSKATFDENGVMTLIEVVASPTGPGPIASIDVPLTWVTFPVELYHNAELVGRYSFKAWNLRESTIQFAMARTGSDYFWSDKYKFALWEPYSTTVFFDVATGRPARITMSVRPSTYEKAQTALAVYLALGGAPKKA